MVLDTSWFIPQKYKVCIKGKVENPGKGVAPSVDLGVVALDNGHQLTHTQTHTHIYIYMCVCVCVCVLSLLINNRSQYVIYLYTDIHEHREHVLVYLCLHRIYLKCQSVLIQINKITYLKLTSQ